MSIIHLHQTTTATPEQFVAALTDFGPGRQELFANSADEDLEVHELGVDEADVTEGSGGVWERLHYDWSDPERVVMTTTDSNVWGGRSGHTYTFTRRPDGTTDVDAVVIREGKNPKGRVLGFVLGTIGKSLLSNAFDNTVKAVEARNAAASAAAVIVDAGTTEIVMSTLSAVRTKAAGTAVTAENRSIEIDGASLVYRRFGNRRSEAPPLLFLQHFRGNLDNWDPALVDRLAAGREVILLDNRGVGASTGAVPDNVEDMARDVLRFVDALGLTQVDLLGFSLGGYVAQEIALVRPRLVRRIVLAGTAPQGAPGIHRWSDEVYALATPDVPDPEGFLRLFFPGSDDSRERGMEYFVRTCARSEDRDAPTDLATRDAQLEAITRWGVPDTSKLARLAAITQPALVANGDDDTMMITENSRLLAEHLPDAQLRIYEDAGHGFLDQYPALFAHHVGAFLDGD